MGVIYGSVYTLLGCRPNTCMSVISNSCTTGGVLATIMFTIKDEKNFLDFYFASIYNKLEADALLFNRKLPHAGLVGSENENAIAEVIREFLPVRFGVEVSGLVIDRHGNTSKQCDIIIYDAERFPKYFRKVFPVELTYGVIEVKTSMSKKEADAALQNLRSINELDFRPVLTNYWITRTSQENIHHSPPFAAIFAYRTQSDTFETFAKWFSWQFLHQGIKLKDKAPQYPEIRTLTIGALDQGLIKMESTNGYITRHAAISTRGHLERGFPGKVKGTKCIIDPAKSLFFFLERLWVNLSDHHLHPGFDIRSYMSPVMDSAVIVRDLEEE